MSGEVWGGKGSGGDSLLGCRCQIFIFVWVYLRREHGPITFMTEEGPDTLLSSSFFGTASLTLFCKGNDDTANNDKEEQYWQQEALEASLNLTSIHRGPSRTIQNSLLFQAAKAQRKHHLLDTVESPGVCTLRVFQHGAPFSLLLKPVLTSGRLQGQWSKSESTFASSDGQWISFWARQQIAQQRLCPLNPEP